MFTNHTTVTLFCSKKLGREKVWTRHVLHNVNFHGTDQLLNGDKEVKRREEYVIRVPAAELEQYVDAYSWKALAAEEIHDFFTFAKGDYIVKGIVEDDVSSSTEILKFHEAYEITEITENLRASSYSQHIKLVVK
ncbi:hypothetical protein SAMN02910436_02486 [Ruminococcaceae bacterium P7]|nr:hypothetical protein SAMN02910436_02486 [Ruminococcaceae bacterium P7]